MKDLDWAELSPSAKDRFLNRPALDDGMALSEKVRLIIQGVRDRGDAAVRDYTETYDRVQIDDFRVGAAEIERAYSEVDPKVLADIKEAIGRIDLFHRAQLPEALRIETAPGVVCEKVYRPIARVGLYIPGGTAPLPSTVMMLGVPARIAGGRQRVLVTPPMRDGTVDPYIRVTAHLLGITEIYRVGGAQAIAALAYGTESIPKVDKIFGPGNAWVTEAKIQVSRDARGAMNDLPAGPSEVLVIADAAANPAFVASDLLSQAEHGEDSQVVLVSDSSEFISSVRIEIERQLRDLPRESIARASLENSWAVKCRSIGEAMEISNAYAPEHLILQVERARERVSQVENAGSVFVGPFSPESAGDYSSGTNHVLPTYGYARATGGVTLESFLKPISVQEISRDGLLAIGPGVERLAEVEGLRAHRNAVSIRLESLR